ncbi:unnamed protein product [Adineta ricciae]|uniref:Uncharacterized protein n=1 Tax=Adineta ricciae TaxID=249248 RepID=A0A814N2U9_ADIRI|nr:unnamed protein product [Adineta ricciae]
MQLVRILNVVLIALISLCYGDSNSTIMESVPLVCKKCSPCWNVFSENFGPCSNETYHISLFNNVQPVCMDTLVLLIIMFLSIVILTPTCLWLCYLWIKRCRNVDAKYIVNERAIM